MSLEKLLIVINAVLAKNLTQTKKTFIKTLFASQEKLCECPKRIWNYLKGGQNIFNSQIYQFHLLMSYVMSWPYLDSQLQKTFIVWSKVYWEMLFYKKMISNYQETTRLMGNYANERVVFSKHRYRNSFSTFIDGNECFLIQYIPGCIFQITLWRDKDILNKR